MLLQAETKQIQEQLARYCRTGQDTDIKGVRQDRLSHYRRLVYNAVSNTLESAFPISEEWLSTEEWQLLVGDFFEHHDAQTPSIWKLPEEFANYIIENDYAAQLNKPALNDLLWFEWLEIEVHTMEDKFEPEGTNSNLSIKTPLSINPYYRIQQLKYPIHMIHADQAAKEEGEYFVLIYRLIESGQVRFIQLSPMHIFFIDKISNQTQSISQVLPELCSVFGIDNLESVKDHLFLFCSNMITKKILIIS